MKRTSRAATLLLAVLLVFLAGCSRKQAPPAYEAPVRAFEALLNNPEATWHDAVQSVVGGFCSDELTQLAELLIQTGDTTDERMTENLIGRYRDVYGYDCTFRFVIESAEPMDDATLKHYRDKLQEDAVFFEENLAELQRDGAIDWESGQPLESTTEMEQVYTTLHDRFTSAEVSEGYVIKLNVTVSGGDLKQPETSEDTMNVLCIDGVWVIGDVFDKPYTK